MSLTKTSAKISIKDVVQKKSVKPTHFPRRLRPIDGKLTEANKSIAENRKSFFQQELTKPDINRYRLSHYENVCISLLQTGYHSAFTELFTLVETQKQTLAKADQSSTFKSPASLRERPDILHSSVDYLIRAELAEWARDYDEVYKTLLRAVDFFRLKTNEDFLVNHFLWRCSEVANKTLRLFRVLSQKSEESLSKEYSHFGNTASLLAKAKRRANEASFHIMTFLAETGEISAAYSTAKQLYETLENEKELYKVPPANPDQESDSRWIVRAPRMSAIVCEHLCRCLLHEAEQVGAENPSDKFPILSEALKFGTESGNQGLVGSCKLAISSIYEQLGDYNLAHKYAYEYYTLAEKLDDRHRVAACSAAIRIYEKLGDVQKAQRLLIKLERLANACNDPLVTIEVEKLVSQFHVRQTQDYTKAYEAAENGFRLALEAGISDMTKTMRLWCGIAKGQSLYVVFGRTVLCAPNDSDSMMSLLNWRSNRAQMQPIDHSKFRDITNFSMQRRREQVRENQKLVTSTQGRVHSVRKDKVTNSDAKKCQ
ncbi:Tetratricopeptide repeat protein 29 [Clonorchis sinensis]|uniref:Tetratricopeptide repeat protein 29 n=1 Tax=Clonorchis sinensis TaxID=79923 RepID=A0A8T1M7W9_CLOSI|nr:Tetratricopeptide repeat protein 29 [Clonorchis sinensis]